MGIFPKINFNFFKREKKADDDDKDYSSTLGLAPPSLGQAVREQDQAPSAPRELVSTNLPPLTTTPQRGSTTPEFATQENMKAKIDLMLTQIDSMRIQYDSMNERVLMIDKMVRQLLDMAKS